ncbi:MAG: HAMP domain-containing histidine kinase, partial [Candidatus Hydrogenedentes bacterium]|nr:HAMP domain-containing histidine kinase [Candidatus Hydrogenedentota bacterium]
DRLRDVDARITSFLAKRERELLALHALSDQPVERLRTMARESAIVRQFFVMNDRDELRYPISIELVREYAALKNVPSGDGHRALSPPSYPNDTDTDESLLFASLTSGEKEFLDRTQALWIDKRIPATNLKETVPAEMLLSKFSKGSGYSKVPASPAKGWYAWYWGDGLNLIFWWRDESGVIVGSELNPVRLAADIVGLLPDTHPESTTLSGGAITLCDSNDSIIYQWGMFDLPENIVPVASLPLHSPLSVWRLEYYSPPGVVVAGIGQGAIFNLILGLFALGLAVMALAVYYYRESSREMREATQRVSFVNQVSHELKTPLTSIRMYAEMLAENLDEGDEKAQRHVGVIVAESQRLSRLIGNVLTFSRKQRSALKLHKVSGNIDSAIGGVLEHFQPALTAKGFEIVFDAGAGAAVEFDPDVLEQILGNLIGNIEKYALVGGHAVIVSSRQENRVSILVSDSGPGIPAQDR